MCFCQWSPRKLWDLILLSSPRNYIPPTQPTSPVPLFHYVRWVPNVWHPSPQRKLQREVPALQYHQWYHSFHLPNLRKKGTFMETVQGGESINHRFIHQNWWFFVRGLSKLKSKPTLDPQKLWRIRHWSINPKNTFLFLERLPSKVL